MVCSILDAEETMGNSPNMSSSVKKAVSALFA
jgi:hypothetical protein